MLPHARHRRGSYPLAGSMISPQRIVALGGAAILAALIVLMCILVLRFFGVGNSVRRMPALLVIGGRGNVNVTLDGGDMQRAQDGMKLFSADRTATGNGSFASLHFFDDSVVRLDEGTELTIRDAALGSKDSTLDLALDRGSAWISTPDEDAFTGSIVRLVETPFLSLTVPPRTEVLLRSRSIIVFDSSGPGIVVDVPHAGQTIIVGEGQKFSLPEADEDIDDLYAFRSPLDPLDARSPFVEQSRRERTNLLDLIHRTARTQDAGSQDLDAVLVIREPKEGATVEASTVKVSGQIGETVSSVRVNDYQAIIDVKNRSFTQELSVPGSEGTMEIRIAAFDDGGNVLEEMHRTVQRKIVPLASPSIDSPAKSGESWRTEREEFVIRGRAPAGAIGLIVNDYRLQLFTPGNEDWQYLASVKLGNLHAGENRYDVVALDASGRKSPVASIMVLVEPGAEGVISSVHSSVPSQANVGEVLQNAPLKPGTLIVTGPTPGRAHTATGSEFLMEGITDPDTSSVWVSGYKLFLFTPGKTTWNYIASARLNTLKPGRNVYRIVSRNAKGEILDATQYVVTYRP